MDNTAIKQIQKSSSIPELIKQLSEVGTTTPTIIAPDDFKVTNLENYMEFRTHYRLNYKTSSIEAFSRYCTDFDQKGASCFVDSDKMKALTIFDLGTIEAPRHHLHRSGLELNKTAPYKALLKHNDTRLDQRTAAEFIEDWSDSLTIYSVDGATMSYKEAVRAFRTMSIEALKESRTSVGNFAESQTTMEQIEANKKGMLPGEMIFECEPYLHFLPRKFKIRVSISITRESPALVFRIIRFESICEEMAEEFLEKLEGSFSTTKIKTYIGEV